MANNLSTSNSSQLPAAALSALLLSLLTAWLVIVMPPKSGSYYAALADKDSLVRRTAPPRLILTGGSSLPFSINSLEISRALGLPVIDLGLHAGFGLKFILNQIEASMKEGDRLVIVPEYELFSPGHINGSADLASVAVFCPESLRFINSPGQYLTLFRYFPEALKNRLHEIYRVWFETGGGKDIFPVYSRNAFNAEGDIRDYLTPVFERVNYADYPRFAAGEKSFSLLRAFAARAAAMNVKVFFMYPAVTETYYRQHRDTIKGIAEKMRGISGLTLVGAPEDFVFPEKFFYDTVYHLNADGRKVRTQKLIRLLLETGLSAK